MARRLEDILGNISIIGAGNMGTALVEGLIRGGDWQAESLVVYDTVPAKSESLKRDLKISVAETIEEAVTPDTSAVILAVKPKDIGGVLEKIAPRVHAKLLVISIAAGLTTVSILARLGEQARVIRAMPNSGATEGESATALCRGGAADDEDVQYAIKIFSAVGLVREVDEKLMNVVTALSGSGPGYLFVIMEALMDGAVLLGLDQATARALAIQTVKGAAAVAAGSDAGFSDLKYRVTSPGGTTIAGLNVIERQGLRGILMDAIVAANQRGEELGK